MKNQNQYRWGLPLLCLLSYLVSGKENIAMSISDTFFLVGIVCLIVGGAKIVKKTGFFYLPRYGFKQFFSIITNAKYSREPIGDSYTEFLHSTSKDDTYKFLSYWLW